VAGLPEPKVVGNLKNRGAVLDAAEDAAVGKTALSNSVARGQSPIDAAFPDEPPRKVTAAEAAAKSAKYKADREAFDAETKRQAGLPKPGLLNRLFGN